MSLVFRSRIKELRMKAGMTFDELAEKSGLSKTHCWALEHKEKDPGMSTLMKLAKAFNVTLQQLVGEDELDGKEAGVRVKWRRVTESRRDAFYIELKDVLNDALDERTRLEILPVAFKVMDLFDRTFLEEEAS